MLSASVVLLTATPGAATKVCDDVVASDGTDTMGDRSDIVAGRI